ncbi:MAG: hypothetical protein FVQ78_06475 [Solirubrobacterales bacterium]|nr:hypothetical protein [Solirubrobacterales bacterium]
MLSAAVFAASLLAAPAAQAEFHLIKVREVHPGSSDDSYVVLQMLQPGEKFVGGHSLRVYDASGGTKYTFTFTAGDVYSSGYIAPNGDHGNNTILVGGTGVQAAFGVAPDDRAEAGFEIDAGGGAVCWLAGQPPDCVSWGNFSGSPTSPTGAPAEPAGIPNGMALRRTIAPNCPSLLEAADDRNSSALDFFLAFPSPRPNSVTPTERACSGSGAQGGDQRSGAANRAAHPQTRIRRRPRRRTRDRTPTFRFTSSRARSTFLCKLDRRRFRRCRSPFTTRRLSFGWHLFKVKARAANGRVDPSPASYRFKVVKRKRRH